MATNLFVDPSFETRTDIWGPRENCTISYPASGNALDGTKVMRLKADAAGNMAVGNYNDRTPIGAGVAFIYSLRVRPVGATARQAFAFCDYRKTNNDYLGDVAGSPINCPAGVWTTLSVTGMTPTGNTHLLNFLKVMDVTVAGEEWDVDLAAVYAGSTDPSYQGPYTAAAVADAGPDQSVAAGATVTLTGTPPSGVWSQASGTAVTLSTPVTTGTDTKVTFAAANSTASPLSRVFTYTVA